MHGRRPLCLILAASVWVCVVSAALAQDRVLAETGTVGRVALLIGNQAYQNPTVPGTLKNLKNACNDVEKIAAELERDGWDPEKEIIKACNITRSKMADLVYDFKTRYFDYVNTLGFIYYSGHGIAVDSETYLFGTDAKISVPVVADRRVRHPNGAIFDGGLRLYGDVISAVGDAGMGSIFIVIDACRENPIDDYLMQQSATNPGLAKNWRPGGSYSRPRIGIKLLYSTTYGDLASDGVGGNSPFAERFVEIMNKWDRIADLVGAVIRSVSDSTRNSRIKQIPDVVGELNPPPPMPCLVRCKK